MTGSLTPASRAIIARPGERKPVAYSDADYVVSEETAERIVSARPENTRIAYEHNWKQFTRWCESQGRVACPATPQTLCDYLTRLIGISLAPATLVQIIGTIRSCHRDAGYKGEPDTTRALEMLHSYRREWADAGGEVRKAKPILVAALRAMVDTCDPDTPTGIRDRCLLLTGFNGMCRRSELSRLDLANISEVPDEGMTIFIRYSKTDPTAKGVAVAIPLGQYRETCAVRTTRAWREVLAEHGLRDGALYRPVDRHGRIGGEPQASGHAAARLTGKAVGDIVRRRALLAGIAEPGKYTGHSLRSGGATSAYLAGAPVAEIAKHGRWAENSPVVLGYIRAVDDWKNNPMKGIGL